MTPKFLRSAYSGDGLTLLIHIWDSLHTRWKSNMLKPLTFSPTRLAITTVLAVTCLESAQAQSGNWEDYYRNLQRNRQQYLSRERDWYRQRQNEYQSHSVEPRDSYDGRRFVVEDATAAPGAPAREGIKMGKEPEDSRL